MRSEGMPWDEWGWPESRPRRPANGIKAKSQRGRFGQTWWAGRWIAALERLVDAGRLSRGRSYARSGQVVSLDVGPGGVQARVQGSRPTPYRVQIAFKSLTDDEWEPVIDALAADALYAANLLNGEMPEQIEEVFTAAGASLFPATKGDLETDCSCPDYANPCKHVAAVHYLLGERFDEDPFLIFALRGRDQEDIAAVLRERRAGGATAAPDPAAEEGTAEEGTAEATPEPLFTGDPAAFWSAGPTLENLPLSFERPRVDAAPVKQWGAPSFWPDPVEFTVLMEEAYRAAAAAARRGAFGDEGP
ncbi:MAG TPA: SWIM zinc finger family protein [Dehalococcoidia bacterium]|nr:SWIM zinc finger family protein [Dehalococcoidia bacterium]